MGTRSTKGLAVARYLTGSTGIPMLSWDGGHSRVLAPSPYTIDLTTSRKLQNWHDLIREIDSPAPHMVIRYDKDLPDVSHAWVAMKLMGFAPLLGVHYETISDRIKGE
jgi:hypothetical protein